MTFYVYDSVAQLTSVGSIEDDIAYVKSDRSFYQFFNFSLITEYSYEFSGADKILKGNEFSGLPGDSFTLDFWIKKSKNSNSNVFNSFITRSSSITDEKLHNITAVGSPTAVETNYYEGDQSSIYFPNDADLILINDCFNSLPTFAPHSFEYAYFKNGSNKDVTMSIYDNGNTNSLIIDRDGFITNGSAYTFDAGEKSIDDNSWTHNALVFDGFDHKFYKNGQLLPSTRTTDIFDSGNINLADMDIQKDASFSFKTTFSTASDSSTVLNIGGASNNLKIKSTNFGQNLILTLGSNTDPLSINYNSLSNHTDSHVVSFDVRINPGRIRLWMDSEFVGFDSQATPLLNDRWTTANFSPLLEYTNSYQGTIYRSPTMLTSETGNRTDGAQYYSRTMFNGETLEDNADGTFDYHYLYPAVKKMHPKPFGLYSSWGSYGLFHGWHHQSWSRYKGWATAYGYQEYQVGSNFFSFEDLDIRWRPSGTPHSKEDKVYYFEFENNKSAAMVNAKNLNLIGILTDKINTQSSTSGNRYYNPTHFMMDKTDHPKKNHSGYEMSLGDGVKRNSSLWSNNVKSAIANDTKPFMLGGQSSLDKSTSIEFMISEPDQKVFYFQKGVFKGSTSFPTSNTSGFLRIIFQKEWYKHGSSFNHSYDHRVNKLVKWGYSYYNYGPPYYAAYWGTNVNKVKLRISPNTWQYNPNDTLIKMAGSSVMKDLGSYGTHKFLDSWSGNLLSDIKYNRQLFLDKSAGDTISISLGGNNHLPTSKSNKRYIQGFNASKSEKHGNIGTSVISDSFTKINVLAKSSGGTILSYNTDGTFIINNGTNRSINNLLPVDLGLQSWKFLSFSYRDTDGGTFDLFVDGIKNSTHTNLGLSISDLKLSTFEIGNKDSWNITTGTYDNSFGNFDLHGLRLQSIARPYNQANFDNPTKAYLEDANTLLLTANDNDAVISAVDVSPYSADEFVWKKINQLPIIADSIPRTLLSTMPEILSDHVGINNTLSSFNFDSSYRTQAGDSFSRSSHLVSLKDSDDAGNKIDWTYDIVRYSNPILQTAHDSFYRQFYVKAYDLSESNVDRECYINFTGKHVDSGNTYPTINSRYRTNDSFSSNLRITMSYSGDFGLQVSDVSDHQLYRYITLDSVPSSFDSSTFIFDAVGDN